MQKKIKYKLVQVVGDENTLKLKGFSLAELMIVLLILAIILAATMPILSKRAKVKAAVSSSGSSLWQKISSSSDDIYYGATSTSTNRVAIGTNTFGSTDARLQLNIKDATQNQVVFQQAGTEVGRLLVDNTGNIGLGNVTTTTLASGKSLAIGSNAKATGYATVGVGKDSKASGNSAIAIGSNASADNIYSLAIGPNAKANAFRAIAIGDYTNNDIGGTPGEYSIVLGDNSTAQGDGSVVMGASASGYGKYSAAIGRNAYTYNDGTVAIGSDANGAGAQATATNQFVLGTASHFVHIPGTLTVAGATTMNGNVTLGDATSDAVTIKGILSFGSGSVSSGGSSSYTLRMNGTSGTVYYGSDKRIKNVESISQDGLEKIKQINVYNYTYKNDKAKAQQVGVMAQDLQKVFPHSVEKQKNGYLMIRHEDMFFAMINSIKQLDKMVQDIISDVKSLALCVQKIEEKIVALAKSDKVKNNKIKQLEIENKQLKNKNAEFEKRLVKIEKTLKKHN